MDTNLLYKQVVDFLAPLQTPTEQAVYYYIIRQTVLEGKSTFQIGDRALAKVVSAPAKGKLSKSKGLSPGTIQQTLKSLQDKGHIYIHSIEQKGKVIEARFPYQIDECVQLMEAPEDDKEVDYYTDPKGRRAIFDRDEWTCQYCGDPVDTKNIVLDHYIPQHAGGDNSKENLKTACIPCNSVKSGKSFEEASVFILKSIRERKMNS